MLPYMLLVLYFSYGVASYLARAYRQKLLRETTGVMQLPLLKRSRTKGEKIKGTAVVCGGGVAGLAAARVCHSHFDKVVIVEPEAWLATAEAWDANVQKQNVRSRLMQYKSFHVFQQFGYRFLAALFPNLEEECMKADILTLPADLRFNYQGNELKVPVDEYWGDLPKMLYFARASFESLLRRLLFGSGQYPNLEQIVGTVTGIERTVEEPERVGGVTIRTKDGNMTLPAALVIDCTGPAQAGLKWLRRAGFEVDNPDQSSESSKPIKLSYELRSHYSTLRFTFHPSFLERYVPPEMLSESGMLYSCVVEGDSTRDCVHVQRAGRNSMEINLGTRGDTMPPQTLQGTKEFIRSLKPDMPVPGWFFNLLDGLDEVEDTMGCSALRLPPLVYIQYHEAKTPDNWIAIGDSVMVSNPIWGQGICKAFLGALVLNTHLQGAGLMSDRYRIPPGFSRQFFRDQTTKTSGIWLGTKAYDYAYRFTVPVKGETLKEGRFLRWYTRKVLALSQHDDQAGSVLWHAAMHLAPGIDYFQPSLVLKVLWEILTSASGVTR